MISGSKSLQNTCWLLRKFVLIRALFWLNVVSGIRYGIAYTWTCFKNILEYALLLCSVLPSLAVNILIHNCERLYVSCVVYCFLFLKLHYIHFETTGDPCNFDWLSAMWLIQKSHYFLLEITSVLNRVIHVQ